jgi:hypothetical protein
MFFCLYILFIYNMDSEQYKTQIAHLNKVFNKNVNNLKNKLNRLINNVKRLNLSPSIKKQYINRYISRYNISVKALKNGLSSKISSLFKNRKFALLVGINYKNTVNELYGCINDTNNIRDLLNQKYGYNKFTFLTDNTNKKPTKQNIIYEFTNLLTNATPGDSLFFLYSGHGTFSADLNGDELDGQDELIVPIDSTSISNCISDDEFNKIIQDNLKPNVKLFALFDSCHSGSMLDLKYTYSNPNSNVVNNPNVVETVGQVFMISGCKDDQTSSDAVINTGKKLINTGAMTYSFLKTIEQEGKNVTIKKLIETMLSKLKDGGFTQTPLFSCGNSLDISTVTLDL